MSLIGVAVYMLACALVASLGRKRILGFWICFVLSLLFTPVPILLLLLITLPRQAKTATE